MVCHSPAAFMELGSRQQKVLKYILYATIMEIPRSIFTPILLPLFLHFFFIPSVELGALYLVHSCIGLLSSRPNSENPIPIFTGNLLI